MGTVRKTTTLNESEYIRDLVRRVKSRALRAVKEAIREGRESTDSDKNVKQIAAQVEARLTAEAGLSRKAAAHLNGIGSVR